MEQHVKIIGVIDIVFGILGVLGGILIIVAFLLGGAGIGASGEQGAGGAGAIVAGVGLIGGLFAIAISGFQIYVGSRLQQYKSWARVVQIILGVISLPGFPVGTALGVYFLWAMLNEDTKQLFEQKQRPTMRQAA